MARGDIFNWELFENFKEAVSVSGLTLKKNDSYYSVEIPNTKRYIYCWTPMNKMQWFASEIESGEYDQALDSIKQNIQDFRLEIDSRDTKEDVASAYYREGGRRTLTVDEILNIIQELQDDRIVASKILIAEFIFSD